MGMTIAEKILAAHSGRSGVRPGEFILAEVDLTLANDITAPLAIRGFREAGGRRVRRPERIALVMDHFVPCKDIESAAQVQMSRRFAREQGIAHFYEGHGIAHALLPESGLVGPGDLVVGADSHTCTYGALGAFATGMGSTDIAGAWLTGKVWLRVPETIRLRFEGVPGPWTSGKDLILHVLRDLGTDGATYRVLEFEGEGVRALPMSGRFTLANMAVETGAKAGIIPPDARTRAFVEERCGQRQTLPQGDPDARYAEERTYRTDRIEPLVALPSSPANVVPVDEARGTPVDQVVIGSCTNGWMEDLEAAARILQGRRISPEVRLLVIPATRRIYLEALRRGIMEIFLDAGAVVAPPTCGPCLGGHMGVLAPGERALATTNRNFTGRMGDPTSEVYLAGPAVAAATALRGRIAHPAEVATSP